MLIEGARKTHPRRRVDAIPTPLPWREACASGVRLPSTRPSFGTAKLMLVSTPETLSPPVPGFLPNARQLPPGLLLLHLAPRRGILIPRVSGRSVRHRSDSSRLGGQAVLRRLWLNFKNHCFSSS